MRYRFLSQSFVHGLLHGLFLCRVIRCAFFLAPRAASHEFIHITVAVEVERLVIKLDDVRADDVQEVCQK